MLRTGIREQDVFNVTSASADGNASDGLTVIRNSNSFPGSTVRSAALNAELVHCNSESWTNSGTLLTMRKTLVSFVAASLEKLNEAADGLISIGL
jgi:hypothetical protein